MFGLSNTISRDAKASSHYNCVGKILKGQLILLIYSILLSSHCQYVAKLHVAASNDCISQKLISSISFLLGI